MSSLRSHVAELRAITGVPEAVASGDELATLVEFLEFILDGGGDISEGSKMDPFKHKSKIGPGPYGRHNVKRRKDRFKCKCSSQGSGALCKCKSRTRNKVVFVSYDYKNSYNPVYRAWLKKRHKSKAKKKKTQSFQTKAKVG